MRFPPPSFVFAFALVAVGAVLRAQELPVVELRTVPDTALRYAVQLPQQWDAARWAPMVVVLATGEGDDAARAAISELGADVPRAGFVVVSPVRSARDAAEFAPLLTHLRRTFRIEQGGMHALAAGSESDVQLLRTSRWQFQTMTFTGTVAGPSFHAVKGFPARRVYPRTYPGDAAAHFGKMHAERASTGDAAEVARVLDDFHDAAANADAARYFAILPADAVFLGTDGTERWTGAAFRAQMAKYFARDSAWTYVALQRHVDVEPDQQVAWFDETLDNEAYGECRGTGVMVKRDGRWVLRQYNLTVPVPNDLARAVTAQIRAAQGGGPPGAATTFVVVRHAEKATADPDTDLSAAGRARADALARVLRDLPITAAYSSGMRRTEATIAPTCAARGVTSVGVGSPGQTVERLRAHRGETVLVCGHSNTVPEILKGLGVEERVTIADDEYDRLFVVTLGAGGVRLVSLRY